MIKQIKSILELSKHVNVLVSIAVEKENKYLMVKEAKKEVRGLWNFPSGKVHLNEDLVTAAQREFLEETGRKCKITNLMNIYYFYWDDLPGVTIRFNFFGQIVSSEKSDLACDVTETKWFSIDEIEKLARNNKLRAKTTKRQIKDIKNNIKYPLDIIKKP